MTLPPSSREWPNPEDCLAFYELLWDIACAKGVLKPSHKNALRDLCVPLGLPPNYFVIFYRRRSATFREVEDDEPRRNGGSRKGRKSSQRRSIWRRQRSSLSEKSRGADQVLAFILNPVRRIDKAMYEARNILCMTERQLIKYANVFFSDKQECLRLGKSAYRQGLYEEAMTLLGGAGSKVDADAQFMIGQMYAKGRGVEKNKEMSKCLLDLDDAYMLVSKDGIKWT